VLSTCKWARKSFGSFGGDLQSDGKLAQLKLSSAMSEGAITGGITLGLADPKPLDGKISVRNINLDPFLLSALHLGKFGGSRRCRWRHHVPG